MEKKLLFSVRIEDCKVQTFTVKGKGGAGKDTSNTGVRVVHPPSGAAGVGVTHRSQHKNKLDAFKRMRKDQKFKVWHMKMVSELMSGKTIEQKVDEAMQPENLKVEVRTPGGWAPVDCDCHWETICSEDCAGKHHAGCPKACKGTCERAVTRQADDSAAYLSIPCDCKEG